MKPLLKLIFGNGTRGVQTFNYVINSVWLVLLAMHIDSVIVLDVPLAIEENIGLLFAGAVVVQCVSTVGFIAKDHYKHQLLKAFALLLNALLQLIVAIGYVSAYPPFEITVLMNSAFACWFIFAVLYIVKVEGLRDDGTT